MINGDIYYTSTLVQRTRILKVIYPAHPYLLLNLDIVINTLYDIITYWIISLYNLLEMLLYFKYQMN